MPILNLKKTIKVLFVGSEASPYAKVGGIASVMYSLPKALRDQGYDARVMIPRYLSIEDDKFNLVVKHKELKVPTGFPNANGVSENEIAPKEIICNVKYSEFSTVPTYFLENMEYYEKRANVYGYADDSVRWGLLCRGVLEFVRQNKEWTPDVIVALDWQSGLLPNYLKTVYVEDPVLSKIATVFSIHNLYYQAMFDHHFVSEMDSDDGHSPIPDLFSDRLQKLNSMRRGIIYSDVFNTVSPNYAKEIMTKEYGEMLDELIRERRSVLTGILNGIDYKAWNPKSDTLIPYQYDKNSLSDRIKNKTALQERLGLPIDNNMFILSIVSRLSKQKGFDLLYQTANLLLEELPIQIVVVGEGDSDMMGFFHDLETRYPGKIVNHLKFDGVLPHLVFAGADAVLVPSRFEPCGLVQMEAMRMGCIPIVRKTGGLADSVEDYDPEEETGTGFVFERFDSFSLVIALIRAVENFKDKRKWKELVKRAMAKDFSWENSAKKYGEFFIRAIKIHTTGKAEE